MQCYRCKGYGHFNKDCPSEDFYKIGPNGLPIRVRDPLRGSSTKRKKPEEKKPSTKALQLGKGRSRSPGSEGVGSIPVPTLGCVEVEVGIAAIVYKTPVVVSAKKKRPNFIIGADFLSAHDCDLSLRQKLFTVGRKSVWCLPERVRSSHARLKLARQVELPPHSEVLASCKATQSIKHFGMSCAVAQPAGVMPKMGWS